jgi:hypothetical protein
MQPPPPSTILPNINDLQFHGKSHGNSQPQQERPLPTSRSSNYPRNSNAQYGMSMQPLSNAPEKSECELTTPRLEELSTTNANPTPKSRKAETKERFQTSRRGGLKDSSRSPTPDQNLKKPNREKNVGIKSRRRGEKKKAARDWSLESGQREVVGERHKEKEQSRVEEENRD